MLFIDSSNFYFHSKKLLKTTSLKFNWASLITALYKKCINDDTDTKLIMAYYYAGIPDPRVDNDGYKKQKKFLNAISSIPYVKVKTGYVLRNKITGQNMEKGVDTMIAVDMVFKAMKDDYDIAILVSADGDFQYSIDIVQEVGKEVYCCTPSGVHIAALKEIADKCITVDASFLKLSINYEKK